MPMGTGMNGSGWMGSSQPSTPSWAGGPNTMYAAASQPAQANATVGAPLFLGGQPEQPQPQGPLGGSPPMGSNPFGGISPEMRQSFMSRMMSMFGGQQPSGVASLPPPGISKGNQIAPPAPAAGGVQSLVSWRPQVGAAAQPTASLAPIAAMAPYVAPTQTFAPMSVPGANTVGANPSVGKANTWMPGNAAPNRTNPDGSSNYTNWRKWATNRAGSR